MIPFCDLRPHLTRLFLLAQPQTEFYYFPLHSQSAATFRPSQPERNFIFNTAYPPSARLFHPRKAPKRILFLTLHSPSAATFFIPMQPRTEFYSLTLHPSPPPPRPEPPALHYNIFGPVGRLSPRGAQGHPTCRIHPTIVPEMRCAAPKRRNFPARKRYGRHKSGRRDGHTR